MLKRRLSCNIIPIIIPVLILALTGCVYFKMAAAPPQKPTFTYRGAELIESTQSGVLVNFLFTAHNPNKAGLKNVTCTYELFVEEKKFLTGNDIPLTLNPKGDTDIKVPATIAYKDLFPVLGSVLRRILAGEKTVPITINALFSGNPAILTEEGKEEPLPFSMRFTRTTDIPLQPERNK